MFICNNISLSIYKNAGTETFFIVSVLVKEVIEELESLLGIAEFSESPFVNCYYKDCLGKPHDWVFWDEYRLGSGEGLNWPIHPELDVFYQV